jgi:hypothetical protein
MSLFLKEEITLAGYNVVVKERIAEGGFGFVDLVVNPLTGQEFVVRVDRPIHPKKINSELAETLWHPTPREF